MTTDRTALLGNKENIERLTKAYGNRDAISATLSGTAAKVKDIWSPEVSPKTTPPTTPKEKGAATGTAIFEGAKALNERLKVVNPETINSAQKHVEKAGKAAELMDHTQNLVKAAEAGNFPGAKAAVNEIVKDLPSEVGDFVQGLENSDPEAIIPPVVKFVNTVFPNQIDQRDSNLSMKIPAFTISYNYQSGKGSLDLLGKVTLLSNKESKNSVKKIGKQILGGAASLALAPLLVGVSLIGVVFGLIGVIGSSLLTSSAGKAKSKEVLAKSFAGAVLGVGIIGYAAMLVTEKVCSLPGKCLNIVGAALPSGGSQREFVVMHGGFMR